MPLSAASNRLAEAHLSAADPVLAAVIEQVGQCTLRPSRDRFGMLVRSIVSQQISTKAARAILQRLTDLAAPEAVSAARLLELGDEALRGIGVSARKAEYALDLAGRVDDGRLKLRTIGRKQDEQIIAELTAVRGIGRWTAQMFLMFALGREDVLPTGDLGIRQAIAKLYKLEELPCETTAHQIALPWRPYATVASWYCWRSLEL